LNDEIDDKYALDDDNDASNYDAEVDEVLDHNMVVVVPSLNLDSDIAFEVDKVLEVVTCRVHHCNSLLVVQDYLVVEDMSLE
jgi:hypothetical protein